MDYRQSTKVIWIAKHASLRPAYSCIARLLERVMCYAKRCGFKLSNFVAKNWDWMMVSYQWNRRILAMLMWVSCFFEYSENLRDYRQTMRRSVPQYNTRVSSGPNTIFDWIVDRQELSFDKFPLQIVWLSREEWLYDRPFGHDHFANNPIQIRTSSRALENLRNQFMVEHFNNGKSFSTIYSHKSVDPW